MPSGIAITAAIAVEEIVRIDRLEEIDAKLAAGHAFPQRSERRGRRRQQHGIDQFQPVHQRPHREQDGDADQRQQRVGYVSRPIIRAAPRAGTISRQCALVAMKSGSDRVLSVRGRGAS